MTAKRPVQPLATATVVPGELSATIGECPAPKGGRAWIYMSHGLERVGQAELLVAVLQPEGVDRTEFPHSPILLFRDMYLHAEAGTTLKAGDRITIAEDDADPRIRGYLLVETRSADYPAVDRTNLRFIPLVALPLFDEEMRAAHRFGQARVLLLLAAQAGYFPYPWWFDARRAAVLEYDAYAGSTMLSRVSVMPVHQLRLTQTGARLRIELPEPECARLHQALLTLPDVFALLPRIPETVDSAYVWQLGPTGPVPLCIHARTELRGDVPIARNFLAMAHGNVPLLAAEDEDGISLTMPEETWRELLDHLRSGEPFAWHMPGLDIREVTFRPLLQKLISPFGGAYGGPGTFLQYSPDRDPPAEFRTPELRNVGTGYMVLLSELPESLTPEALASFVREAELIVDDALDGVTHNCEEMALEFRFWAGVPVAAIRLAVRPGKLPAGVDDAIYKRLTGLRPPPMSAGEMRFQDFLLLRRPD